MNVPIPTDVLKYNLTYIYTEALWCTILLWCAVCVW